MRFDGITHTGRRQREGEVTSQHVLIAMTAVILDLGLWAAIVVWQHAAGCMRNQVRKRMVILDFWFGSVGAPVGGSIATAMVGLLISRSADLGAEIRLGAAVLAVSLPCALLLAKYWAWGPVVKGLLNIDINDDGSLSAVGKLHFVYAFVHFAIGWWLAAQLIFGTGWTWHLTVAGCGYCLVATTIFLDVRNGIQLIPDATFVPFCRGTRGA